MVGVTKRTAGSMRKGSAEQSDGGPLRSWAGVVVGRTVVQKLQGGAGRTTSPTCKARSSEGWEKNLERVARKTI